MDTAVDSVGGTSVALASPKSRILTVPSGVTLILQLQQIRMQRWGNPHGHEFHYADFGGVAGHEGTFGGYTIPTRLRIGWHFGTDHMDGDGEFFRAPVDDASYR